MTSTTRAGAVLGLALAVSACGAKTGLSVDGMDSGLDAGGDAGVDSGSDAGLDAGTDAGFDAGLDAGPECRPFRTTAELATLDVFVVLDSSGSMAEPTSAGVAKAEAVSAALRGFVESPESEGIGVALTFFPEVDETVPELCRDDAECGAGGTCEDFGFCYDAGGELCRTTADCPVPGDRCIPLGYCGGRPETACLVGIVLTPCSRGETCEDFGTCDNRTRCDLPAYAPQVALDVLPGAAPAFVDALEAREAEGGTPTSAAVEGALRTARARANDNPGSKVIVLLATDGFPTQCDPALNPVGARDPSAGIPRVVEVVADGASRGVETFVVGVFESSEEADARANLSAIAAAGGTGEALIVTTAEPVTDRLLAIFEELRRTVRTCIYAIPRRGALPDPADLEVSLQGPGVDPTPLERRADLADCDPVTGGFFFEPVEDGRRPGFAELCPVSCAIASRPDVRVEMQTSCGEDE